MGETIIIQNDVVPTGLTFDSFSLLNPNDMTLLEPDYQQRNDFHALGVSVVSSEALLCNLMPKEEWHSLEQNALIDFENSDKLFSPDNYGIDRLSIEWQAHELIENRSSIVEQYKTEKTYTDDARTLLFEALTASGHLSEVEISGHIDEIHKKMLTVLLNSIDESLPSHEQARRFEEVCEELYRQQVELMIISDALPADTEVATVSDFPADLVEAEAIEIGYRPRNNKGMLRSSRLVKNKDGTYTRVTEQCSRSNSDASTTRDFLAEHNIRHPFESILAEKKPDDILLLGTQFMHRLRGGVVDLMMMLDQHQGSATGVPIQYGESPSDMQLPYEQLRKKSKQREAAVECYIDDLAAFTRQLDVSLHEGKVTQAEYHAELSHRVLTILRAICVVEPNYALDCFGEDAENGFKQASVLAAGGDSEGAAAIVDSNKGNEASVEVCGMSMSEEQAKERGIELTSLAKEIELGRRKIIKTNCPKCDRKNVTAVIEHGEITCGSCNSCVEICTGRTIRGPRKKFQVVGLRKGRENKETALFGEKKLSAKEEQNVKKSKVGSWMNGMFFKPMTR